MKEHSEACRESRPTSAIRDDAHRLVVGVFAVAVVVAGEDADRVGGGLGAALHAQFGE